MRMTWAHTSCTRRLSRRLISRTVGEDSRYNEISITEKGREIVEHSREHFMNVDCATFNGISEEELESFSKCLDKIQNNLNEFLESEGKK